MSRRARKDVSRYPSPPDLGADRRNFHVNMREALCWVETARSVRATRPDLFADTFAQVGMLRSLAKAHLAAHRLEPDALRRVDAANRRLGIGNPYFAELL